MAHELSTNSNGQVEFAYAGEKPWHGLGQVLPARGTSEEILRAANLMWTVSKRSLITCDGIMIPDWVATVRDDNNLPLGNVRPSYEVIQNSQLAAMGDALIGTGDACYETAGSVFGGKTVFMVAKLPETLRVGRKGVDVTEEYLTLMTGHDGSSPVRMFFSPIRVVCNNTLQAALRGCKQSVVIRHSGNIDEKLEMAKEVLGLAKQYFVRYQEVATRLAQVTADAVMVDAFLKDVFQVGKKQAEVNLDDEPAKISAVKTRQMDEVKDLFRNDEKNNLPGIEGTAWALLNASTQWADHIRLYDNADDRMSSVLWGGAADIKQRALDSITSLVKVK